MTRKCTLFALAAVALAGSANADSPAALRAHPSTQTWECSTAVSGEGYILPDDGSMPVIMTLVGHHGRNAGFIDMVGLPVIGTKFGVRGLSLAWTWEEGSSAVYLNPATGGASHYILLNDSTVVGPESSYNCERSDNIPRRLGNVAVHAAAMDVAAKSAIAMGAAAKSAISKTTEALVERTLAKFADDAAISMRPRPPPPSAAPDVPDDPPREFETVAALAEKDTDSQQVTPRGPPLTGGEKEAFGLAVGNCWNVGSLSTSARATKVVVAFDMQRNGMPVTDSIRLVDFVDGSEADAGRAFEAARRAIIRCGTKGFQLPAEKYDQWREMTATFDAEGMQLR